MKLTTAILAVALISACQKQSAPPPTTTQSTVQSDEQRLNELMKERRSRVH